MPQRFPEIVRAHLPNATNSSIAKLQAFYPFPAELPEKLAWDYTTDVVWGCPAYNLAVAYKDRARRFVFSVPPAYHGADMACKLYESLDYDGLFMANLLIIFSRFLL